MFYLLDLRTSGHCSKMDKCLFHRDTFSLTGLRCHAEESRDMLGVDFIGCVLVFVFVCYQKAKCGTLV